MTKRQNLSSEALIMKMPVLYRYSIPLLYSHVVQVCLGSDSSPHLEISESPIVRAATGFQAHVPSPRSTMSFIRPDTQNQRLVSRTATRAKNRAAGGCRRVRRTSLVRNCRSRQRDHYQNCLSLGQDHFRTAATRWNSPVCCDEHGGGSNVSRSSST